MAKMLQEEELRILFNEGSKRLRCTGYCVQLASQMFQYTLQSRNFFSVASVLTFIESDQSKLDMIFMKNKHDAIISIDHRHSWTSRKEEISKQTRCGETRTVRAE